MILIIFVVVVIVVAYYMQAQRDGLARQLEERELAEAMTQVRALVMCM